MAAKRLEGKPLAQEVLTRVAERSRLLARAPGLTVVLVGEDPASQLYVRSKTRTAESLGFRHEQINLPKETSEEELLALVDRLNRDPRVDGILVQSPLPPQIRSEKVFDRIDPEKDVDGFHPVNVGKLSQRRETLVPCTPAGVMVLLRSTGISLKGKEALMVGRSNIVGKPVVQLLEQADCTVTLAHSRTSNLAAAVGRAEILVAAVGVAGVVKGEWVREGAVVIDVGQNRDAAGKLCGDVEKEGASERASWLTPVPGGVGPMTIAMLMENTVTAAERRSG